MAFQSLKRTRPQSSSPAPEKRRCVPFSATRSVRFLIISDTHDAALPSNLPDCDVLLHCGDITEDGSPESISKAIKELGKIKAELKLVIAGNHDISLDKEYYVSEGGSVADVEKAQAIISPAASSEASTSGITFLAEGTHTFTLSSGGTFILYASPFTPAFGASGFQYPTNEDRYNPTDTSPLWAHNVGTEASIVPNNVDIVMTHGPPKYILDSTSDGQSVGCEHLRHAIERVKPKLHCFGHVHTGYGAQRLEYNSELLNKKDCESMIPLPKEWIGKNQAKRKGFASLPPGSSSEYQEGGQTLCINAAMEGEQGVLENAPWVVDLLL
jgi:hypothetical protein